MTNIVRFDPFEDLTRLQREVNRLFEDNSRTGSGIRAGLHPDVGARRGHLRGPQRDRRQAPSFPASSRKTLTSN